MVSSGYTQSPTITLITINTWILEWLDSSINRNQAEVVSVVQIDSFLKLFCFRNDVNWNFAKAVLCLWSLSEGCPNKNIPRERIIESENDEVFLVLIKWVFMHCTWMWCWWIWLYRSNCYRTAIYLRDALCFPMIFVIMYSYYMFFFWLHGCNELWVCLLRMEFRT